MKQRIRVAGIVKKGDDILLLKRDMGRIESEPVWEMPTGKVRFGEQPEEAMTRAIYEYLGVKVASLKLMDVITFVALAGASRLSNLYIIYEVVLAEEEKLAPGNRYTSYKYLNYVEGNSGLQLDDATMSVLQIELNKGAKTSYRGVANGATVYVDGGSRGNPGPSGIGYYIVGENGEELARGGEFIGFATSRVAEYYALKEGCERAIELGLKSVRFIGDSLMMINQMNGIYKVKNQDLIPIYNDVRGLLQKFDAVAFVHVKREQNTIADKEVNLAIDRHFQLDTEEGIGLGHIDA
jgi:ribonuclease HI